MSTSNKPCKWATSNDRSFFPRLMEKESETLPPGVYTIKSSQTGCYFHLNKPIDLSELIRFDDTGIDEAVSEIQKFWTKKDLFNRHDFAFRRGILLHGPPGSGKSCAIKMIIQDVVSDGGIAIMFTDAELFDIGMDFFRDIQPETKVVVVMEDLDSWMNNGYESEITNLLDGHKVLHSTVFLATTNYIDALSDRIKNRPSRFDKRIYIGAPSKNVRKEYLVNLLSKSEFKDKVDVDKWAEDSKDLTFAHLKEMYLSICFFDADYDETIERLRDMVADEDEDDDLNLDLKKLIKKHTTIDIVDDDDEYERPVRARRESPDPPADLG